MSFKSGIKVIDNLIGSFSEHNIISFLYDKQYVATTLVLQIIRNYSNNYKNTLLITSKNINEFSSIAENKGISLQSYLEQDKLTILNYPPDIKTSVQTSDNINLIFKDLGIYIKKVKPDLVIFYPIDYFLPDITNENFKPFIKRFSFFLNNFNTNNLLFCDDSSYKNFFSKSDIFTANVMIETDNNFSFDGKNNLLSLISRGKSINEVSFKLDLKQGFLNKNLELHELKLLSKNFKNFVVHVDETLLIKKLKRLFKDDNEILVYNSLEQITSVGIKDFRSIFFVPDYINNYKFYDFVEELISIFPKSPIIVLTTKFIATHHRFKINEARINNLLYRPFLEEDIIRVINKIGVKRTQLEIIPEDSYEVFSFRKTIDRFTNREIIRKEVLEDYFRKCANKALDMESELIFVSITISEFYIYLCKTALNKRLNPNLICIKQFGKKYKIIILIDNEDNVNDTLLNLSIIQKSLLEKSILKRNDTIDLNKLSFFFDTDPDFNIESQRYPYDFSDMEEFLKDFII